MKKDGTYYQTKTRQEVANEYGITTRTFRRWLKARNINLPRTLINPKDLSRIYSVFGNPKQEKQEKQET